MLDRRPRWMGLGPFPLYGLQEARAKALEARRLRHEGVDPIRSCDVKQPARGNTAKRIRSRFIVASSGELSNRAQGLRDVVERLQNRRSQRPLLAIKRSGPKTSTGAAARFAWGAFALTA